MTIALLVLQVLAVIITAIVPWPLVANFLTRTRSYQLDLTVLFFWIGCTVQAIIYIVQLTTQRPNRKFGRGHRDTFDQDQALMDSVSGVRTFAIINIMYALLMFGGIAAINCLLWLPSYNSTFPVFTDPYDQFALIMSWVVGAFEVLHLFDYASNVT